MNKEVTSKLAMTTLLESMSLFKSSWTKEKESVIMRELVISNYEGTSMVEFKLIFGGHGTP